MSEPKTAMDVASIKQACRRLHMPTIAGQCVRLAEQAIKEKRSHLAFLEALLEAEVEEREKNVVARRLKDAHFPKIGPTDLVLLPGFHQLDTWETKRRTNGSPSITTLIRPGECGRRFSDRLLPVAPAYATP